MDPDINAKEWTSDRISLVVLPAVVGYEYEYHLDKDYLLLGFSRHVNIPQKSKHQTFIEGCFYKTAK